MRLRKITHAINFLYRAGLALSRLGCSHHLADLPFTVVITHQLVDCHFGRRRRIHCIIAF